MITLLESASFPQRCSGIFSTKSASESFLATLPTGLYPFVALGWQRSHHSLPVSSSSGPHLVVLTQDLTIQLPSYEYLSLQLSPLPSSTMQSAMVSSMSLIPLMRRGCRNQKRHLVSVAQPLWEGETMGRPTSRELCGEECTKGWYQHNLDPPMCLKLALREAGLIPGCQCQESLSHVAWAV